MSDPTSEGCRLFRRGIGRWIKVLELERLDSFLAKLEEVLASAMEIRVLKHVICFDNSNIFENMTFSNPYNSLVAMVDIWSDKVVIGKMLNFIIPGQSQSLTDLLRNIVWKCLVWPGVLETLT